MAIVPPVDNPLLPLAGTAVELEVVDEEVEEDGVVAEDDVEVVEGVVGTNVLVDVCVTVTMLPPEFVVVMGGGVEDVVGGGGGVGVGVDVVVGVDGVVGVEVVVGVLVVVGVDVDVVVGVDVEVVVGVVVDVLMTVCVTTALSRRVSMPCAHKRREGNREKAQEKTTARGKGALLARANLQGWDVKGKLTHRICGRHGAGGCSSRIKVGRPVSRCERLEIATQLSAAQRPHAWHRSGLTMGRQRRAREASAGAAVLAVVLRVVKGKERKRGGEWAINCTQRRDEPTTEGRKKNNIYGPGTNGFRLVNKWGENNKNWPGLLPREGYNTIRLGRLADRARQRACN
jgi:hypothetical protein